MKREVNRLELLKKHAGPGEQSSIDAHIKNIGVCGSLWRESIMKLGQQQLAEAVETLFQANVELPLAISFDIIRAEAKPIWDELRKYANANNKKPLQRLVDKLKVRIRSTKLLRQAS